jgi:hypothetical protein
VQRERQRTERIKWGWNCAKAKDAKDDGAKAAKAKAKAAKNGAKQAKGASPSRSLTDSTD